MLSDTIDYEKTYSSNKFGDYKIIKLVDTVRKDGKHLTQYEIKFINTNTTKVVRIDYALRGSVIDHFYPSFCNVGYLGNISSTKDPKLFNVWRTMIARCYNPKHNQYKNYGEKGITVCKEWLCYENFYNDAYQLQGSYLLANSKPRAVQLDKDIKQQNIPHEKKIYSKDTCVWIENCTNVRQRWEDELKNHKQKSEYMGVTINKFGNYTARITVGTIRTHIGTFSNEIAAGNAYNYFARKHNTVSINKCPYMPKEEWLKYMSYSERFKEDLVTC